MKHMKAWLQVQGKRPANPIRRDSGTGKSPLLYLDGFNLTQYTLFDLDLTADDTEVVPPRISTPNNQHPTPNNQGVQRKGFNTGFMRFYTLKPNLKLLLKPLHLTVHLIPCEIF